MFLSTQIIFLSFLVITVKVSSKECKYGRWSGCSSEEQVKVITPSDTDAKKVNVVKLYHGIIELLRKRNEKQHNQEEKQDQINSDGKINWLQETRNIGATEKRGEDKQQLQQLQEQILKQQQDQLLRQQGKRKQKQKQKQQEEEQKQKYLVDLQQMMLQLTQKQKQVKKDREEKLLELQFLLLQQRQIETLQLQYQQNN